jgi:hypothetical protein
MLSATPVTAKTAIKKTRSGPTTSIAPAAMARYWSCMPLSVPSIMQITKIAV